MGLTQGAYTRVDHLATNNGERIGARPASKSAQVAASLWALLWADLLDGIAAGTVTYVSVGLPTNKSALLVTVHYANGTKASEGGETFEDLAHKCLLKFTDHSAGGDMSGKG